MTDATRAFRDYATRISFNISLSRNQVGHLAGVVAEIENGDYRSMSEKLSERKSYAACALVGGRPNLFIVGHGSLARMGLIEHDPRWLKAQEKHEGMAYANYLGPTYRLTAAGEHVVELLRIAGLIPAAAANTNRKRKARVA